MNDEVKDVNETAEKQVKEPLDEPVMVQLTAEQYEALLDRIEELDAARTARSKPTDIDALAEEIRQSSAAQAPAPRAKMSPHDIDALTNTQLLQLIIDEVNAQVNQYASPIVRDIEELKLMFEIQKAEAKYPDFWDYKDTIYQLGRTQPHLTIEQAYLIASGQAKGQTAKPQAERSESKPRVITGLPPRPSYSGEKPSASMNPRLTDREPDTIRDAAMLAWDKVVGKDKSNI